MTEKQKLSNIKSFENFVIDLLIFSLGGSAIYLCVYFVRGNRKEYGNRNFLPNPLGPSIGMGTPASGSFATLFSSMSGRGQRPVRAEAIPSSLPNRLTRGSSNISFYTLERHVPIELQEKVKQKN